MTRRGPLYRVALVVTWVVVDLVIWTTAFAVWWRNGWAR